MMTMPFDNNSNIDDGVNFVTPTATLCKGSRHIISLILMMMMMLIVIFVSVTAGLF